MAQLSSNTILYSQILYKVRDFVIADTQGAFPTVQDRVNAYNNLLQDIYENVAKPITNFEPLIKGEPPVSRKINNYARSFANDLNVVSNQIDFINAKTVNIFNMFMTEMENEKRYLERIGSKSKILQMYSKSPANDIYYFGDTFDSMEKIDVTNIRNNAMPLISNGEFTLPIGSIKSIRPKKILAKKGNGFLGNNHQVKRSIGGDGRSEYRYMFEDTPMAGAVDSIVDSNPLTFIEVEALHVDKKSGPDPTVVHAPYEFSYLQVEKNNTSLLNNTLIDWSNYNVANPFEVSFEIDYPASRANSIEIVPYFGSSKLVKVNKIEITRKDGTVFEMLRDPIYIGSSLIPLNLELAKNHFYNKAIIRFQEMEVVKAEVFFEQSSYENIEIGHIYWKPNYTTTTSSPFASMKRFNADRLNRDIYNNVEYDISTIVPEETSPNELKKIGDTSKSIQVRLTTKNSQKLSYYISFVLHSFEAYSSNTFPDEDSLRCYFGGWKTSVNNPGNGFNFTSNPPNSRLVNPSGFNPPASTAGVRFYSSQEEIIPDWLAFLDLVFADPSGDRLITLDNKTYLVSDFGIEYVTEVEPEKEEVYDVPLISQQEIYKAKRMAVGIRDISLNYESYANQAEVVSKPYLFDKNVQALMLSVESNAQTVDFADLVQMDYSVSVDGKKWIQISPVQLDNRGIAEVLVFNQNLSNEAKLPGVAYLSYPDVPKVINQVWVKIEVSKSRDNNVTPSIYSYELIAKVEN